jgi:Uma2 family endonuclease
MAAPLAGPLTVEEFLAFDDGTDRRYELVRGRIVAMAPPSRAHAVLVGRLARIVGGRLKPPCDVAVEAGIVPPGRDDTYYQADLAVICSQSRSGHQFFDQPVLVVEVLSPSTEAHDRGQKVPDYCRHPAIQEILLVSTSRKRIERWRRDGKSWVVDAIEKGEALRLESVDAAVDLDTLYDGLELDPVPPRRAVSPPA